MDLPRRLGVPFANRWTAPRPGDSVAFLETYHPAAALRSGLDEGLLTVVRSHPSTFSATPRTRAANLAAPFMSKLHALQIVFILFTFFGPPLLWLVSRRWPSPAYSRAVRWTLALAIVVGYCTALGLKIRADEGFLPDESLPMHLCNWAAVATVAALLFRRKTAFELAYCWGIAGTAQALFTPAIEVGYDLLSVCFLTVHSFIPASVLWLILEEKSRPRPGAYLRVMLWSEVYLVTALVVNYWVKANYGFLTEPPPLPSVLDHYSKTHWLYVLQINLTAVVAFALLLLPWWVVIRLRDRKNAASKEHGTLDAL